MTTDLKPLLGVRLRAARQARGLTQEQLAERIERTVETVSNIERGRNLPGLDTLEILAAVLDMPLAALFADGGTGAPRERAALEAKLLAIA
ncbi:MAG: helix-turn-helix transcriptional regulator, partial [Alphaproteobacteria bacterium]|nr:helix-turn-helix transcriptional regulator [Alphaproteobacteria bacterium]